MIKRKLGRPLIYLESTTSTQDVVKDAALKGVSEGYTVVAGQQEQARGRMGRSFYTAKGGLYFSLLLRPNLKASELTPLPLALGVAVAKSIEDEGLKCGLKWPNDCLINYKKVGGVLVESAIIDEKPLYAVAGVGLNANIPLQNLPEWLRAKATTLQNELGRPVDLQLMLDRILSYFEWLYDELQANGPSLIIKEWLKYDVLIGRSITIDYIGKPLVAVVKGLSKNGLLLVETDKGSITLNSAEATINCW
jgi:BirA family biotin operon repressor/biotin-[acetyl-CoA-carboxylase] ligase